LKHIVEIVRNRADGTTQIDMSVSFERPLDDEDPELAEWDHANIYWSSEKGNAWVYAGESREGHFLLPNLVAGIDYVILATSVSARNVETNPERSPRLSVTPGGDVTPPANVVNFGARQNGDTVSLSWDKVADLDLSHYEIREGGTGWSDARLLVERAEGTSWSMSAPKFEDFTFRIKAVDTSGNYSTTPTTVEIVVSKPENSLVILERNEDTQGWPGTLVDMTFWRVGYGGGDEGPSGRLTVQPSLTLQDKLYQYDDPLARSRFWCTPAKPKGSYTTPEIDLHPNPNPLFGFREPFPFRAEINPTVTILDPGLRWATADFAWNSDTAKRTSWKEYVGAPYRVRTLIRSGTSPLTGAFVEAETALHTGQFVQIRIEIEILAPWLNVALENFSVKITSPIITDSDRNITIPESITIIPFTTFFHAIPEIGVQPDSNQLRWLKASASADDFSGSLRDDSNVVTAGTIDWQAEGV